MTDFSSAAMGLTLVTARLLLAGVFLVAGAAKLVDRTGERQALIDFGVPPRVTPALGTALPLAELAVALALIPVSSAWFGAVGSLSLLLLFVFAIAANLALGRTPDCHCFGQLHSAPAGWSTLVRNAALASVAGFVVLQGRDHPGMSVVGWYGDLTTAQRVGTVGGVVVLILLAAEGMLLFQILRQQGRILLRMDALEGNLSSGVAPSADAPAASALGLSPGTRAPGFRLKGLLGGAIDLEALIAAGKPALLLFTNPNCGPCQALMPDIARWQRHHASALTIAVVTEGTTEENRAKCAVHGISQVLLQEKREVAEIYQAWGTPGAVLIRPDGTIGSPLAQGAEAIRALVAHALDVAPGRLAATGAAGTANGQSGTANHPPVIKIGDRAPSLRFHDLNGKSVTLTDFRGRKTLLLFWNPGCGFCQQMLNDLREWEADPPPGSPNLLLISTGTVQDNSGMNLRSTVLLDHNFQAGSAFGAHGTPMAVLLDAKGRIASEAVAGAASVLALAGAESTVREVSSV
jgi:thiol-disulfide isomerase/thioredoxin